MWEEAGLEKRENVWEEAGLEDEEGVGRGRIWRGGMMCDEVGFRRRKNVG
jgi:hypothetical protein